MEMLCPKKLEQISITPLRLVKHDSDIQSGSYFSSRLDSYVVSTVR